jgi:drug/metabolite transporter, DME family
VTAPSRRLAYRSVVSTTRGWPAAWVLLAAVCFGTTGTAQALGVAETGAATPTSVGAVRIVVGGALLALVGWWASTRDRGRADRGPLTRRDAVLVLVAALGVVAYQPAFFAGVRSTGVAVGTLVALGSAPVLTGLLEWTVLGTPPGRRWLAATALAGAGVAVLSTGGAGTGGSLEPAGVAASVAAGGSYAVYTLAAKRLLQSGWSAEQTMGAAFGTAALLMAGMLPFLSLSWLATPSGAALGVFLGLVPTALAYLLFARGLRRLPASEVSTLTLAEPLTAGLLGILLLHESVGPRFAGGAALLLAGLVVLTVSRPGRRRPGHPDALDATVLRTTA